jgi:hypothetical protein
MFDLEIMVGSALLMRAPYFRQMNANRLLRPPSLRFIGSNGTYKWPEELAPMALQRLTVESSEGLRIRLNDLRDGDTAVIDRDRYERITGEPWATQSDEGKRILEDVAGAAGCDLVSFGPGSDGIYFKK